MSATSVFDTILFGNIFGTDEVRECFSERFHVAHMIEAECALAKAEEIEGIIPPGVAAAIRDHSDVAKIDWPFLAARTEIVGYPVLPLVEQMATWCPESKAGYIHWGATTQDIMDLASVLQMRNGLAIVERLLLRITSVLRSMAAKYRDTPMAGRTHLQHALPVTFGSAAQSKILRAQAGLLLDAMITDFERASGPWHLEWAAIPTAFVSVVGALHQAGFALSRLQVNEDAMLANLRSTRGLIVAEAVMMALAESTGRQEAHEVVYQACVAAHEGGRSLIEALREVPVVVENLQDERLEKLCDPTRYMGTCREMVDELLARSNGGDA